MRALLVGGGGFIGGHVAEALAAAGHDVTVLTRGSGDPRFRHLRADRHDAGALARAMAGHVFDLTVDCVAFDGGAVEGLLGPHAPRLGRYVLISTGQVYLVSRERRPAWREEDATLPAMDEPRPPGSYEHASWSYGMGKRRAEDALRRHAGRLPCVALRLPIVQGAGDGSRRLWAWLARLLDGGPVLLPEGGVQPTRFVWAGDVGRAIVRLAEHPAPEGAYNLASPAIVPLRRFLEDVAALAGVPAPFVDVPRATLEEAGFDMDAFPFTGSWMSVLDPARAATLGLEGTPHTRYLPDVVRWHLEHRPAGFPGDAQRARERAFAARAASGAAP